MAEKKQSKRPSVVGRKVKISEPAAAASSPVGQAGGPGSATVGSQPGPAAGAQAAPGAAAGVQAKPAPGAQAKPAPGTQSRPSVAGKAVAASVAPKPSAAPRPSVAGKAVASAAPKEASSVESGSVSEKTGTPHLTKRGGKRRISRKFIAIAGSIIAVLLVATAVLSWNQWLRYDDAADIQGTWVVQETGATIAITDSNIQLTSDVSYPYTLDTFQKTISFNFGNYAGSGGYVFSPERDVLTITESNPDAEGGKAQTTLVKRS